MIIKNFSDSHDSLPIVAKWLIDEFFQERGQHTVESMVERMKQGKLNEVPIGLIAFEGEEVTGVVNLLKHDLDYLSELTPWLAGMYVRPEHRRKGIAKALIDKCVSEARRFDYSTVYLYTDIPEFYVKQGWTIHEADIKIPNKVVMKLEISR